MTGYDLPPIRRRGVAAVLSSRTIAGAAEAVGVSERTVRRWLSDEMFSAAVREAARASAREAASSLLGAQREAVQTLRAALTDPNTTTRVRAALGLLDHGQRAAEADLDARLDQLERRLDGWTEHDGSPILRPA